MTHTSNGNGNGNGNGNHSDFVPAPPKRGEFCNAAPLPFGRAGPIERHIPSPRIHPPAANSARQERSLCNAVHAQSRSSGPCSYRPTVVSSRGAEQFCRPAWTKVSSLRGCSHAGLAPPVMNW